MSRADAWRRLCDLDWRDLDIEEASAWPWPLQALCCLLATVLTFALLYGVMAFPKVKELAVAERHEAALWNDYRRKAVRIADLEAIREHVDVLESQWRTASEILPLDADIPALIDSIVEAAAGQGLDVEAIRLHHPVAEAFYIEQPFGIQIHGDYHRIADFLFGTMALPWLVTLHDFTLEAVEEEGADRLRLTALAKTYLRREDEGDGP